jgi:protein-tyrosine kinase
VGQIERAIMTVTLRHPPVTLESPAGRASPLLRKASGEAARATQEIALFADPAGRPSEAVRALRTGILTSHRGRGRRALAVCSASRGDGCTSVAVNLAVALSQTGLRVLLIDADLRKPSVHRYFPPIQGAPGLCERLQGADVSLSRSLVVDAGASLSIMPAGKVGLDAPDLLSVDRLRTLFDACQREFDFTIIDTPPANAYADARLISSIVGFALIVAKDNSSFVGDVKALANELRSVRAHIVGAVLSDG